MSRRDLGGGYKVDIRKLGDGWYWHLFYGGERVNGGLSDTWAGALHASRHGCTTHSRWRPVPTVYEL